MENTDQEKIKLMPTKELVEKLQNGMKGIRGVSRLLNGDIRIRAESLEAKKILQEKTDWSRMMARLHGGSHSYLYRKDEWDQGGKHQRS